MWNRIEEIAGAWGKIDLSLDRTLDQRVEWHPLADHCLDVAILFRLIISDPIISNRLETLAGRRIDNIARERLTVLVFYHDLGKASAGFRQQIFPKDHPCYLRNGGHIRPVAALFTQALRERSFSVLGIEEWGRWAERGEERALSLLLAILSHHGKPQTVSDGPTDFMGGGEAFVSGWAKQRDGYDPFQELEVLQRSARHHFPLAFSGSLSAQSLIPSSPRFLHAIAGILTWADWLASDKSRFPYRTSVGEDRRVSALNWAKEVTRLLGLNANGHHPKSRGHRFQDIFQREPRTFQSLVSADLTEQLVILEAETGSGKTEAALWRFFQLYASEKVGSLYFALPTRVAAIAMFERVNRAVEAFFGEKRPPVVLAVPGYLSTAQDSPQGLSAEAQLWDDQTSLSSELSWAQENAKRFLCAPIAVGTIDQALLGTLKLKHAHLRRSSLLRSFLVVDEVHASDDYMIELLVSLLDSHLGAGGYALLMSATLASEAREKILRLRPTDTDVEEERVRPYPLISSPSKIRELPRTGRHREYLLRLTPIIADSQAIASEALEAARAGARVLVIRNTVDGAIKVLRELEGLLTPEDDILLSVNHELTGQRIPTLHHGRFAREDRKKLDFIIEREFGLQRPGGAKIAVGTQTLEQSLDLDADFLITDLCPCDVFLQRLGRCHRHDRSERPREFSQPKVLIAIPEKRDLSPLWTKSANGLGSVRGGVYDDLTVIEGTLRALEQMCNACEPLIVPDMCRSLIEDVLHTKTRQKIVSELGWEKWAVQKEGRLYAAQSLARSSSFRTTQEFERLHFDDTCDVRLSTRLGMNNRIVEFDPPPTSPFGVKLRSLVLPGWWVREASAGLDTPISVPDVVLQEFQIFGERFSYSRLGLQREKAVDEAYD